MRLLQAHNSHSACSERKFTAQQAVDHKGRAHPPTHFDLRHCHLRANFIIITGTRVCRQQCGCLRAREWKMCNNRRAHLHTHTRRANGFNKKNTYTRDNRAAAAGRSGRPADHLGESIKITACMSILFHNLWVITRVCDRKGLYNMRIRKKSHLNARFADLSGIKATIEIITRLLLLVIFLAIRIKYKFMLFALLTYKHTQYSEELKSVT